MFAEVSRTYDSDEIVVKIFEICNINVSLEPKNSLLVLFPKTERLLSDQGCDNK